MVLAVDAAGTAIVSGTTVSSNFPTTLGAYQSTLMGYSDMFVTKLNATGTGVVYSTLLGGSAGETGAAVMLDAAGLATVVGTTGALTDLPTTPGAIRRSSAAAPMPSLRDSRRTEPDSSSRRSSADRPEEHGRVPGHRLLGQRRNRGRHGLIGLPTTPGAWDSILNGSSDAFVTRIDATGTVLLSSTLIGGSSGDVLKVIALDRSGAAVVSGVTESTDFPTTTGMFDSVQDGSGDAIIARITADASTLLYSTFLGGASGETSEGMAIDALGQPVIGGTTRSGNFPITLGAADPTAFGSSEGFATKLDLLPAGAARYGATTHGCTGLPSLEPTFRPMPTQVRV